MNNMLARYAHTNTYIYIDYLVYVLCVWRTVVVYVCGYAYGGLVSMRVGMLCVCVCMYVSAGRAKGMFVSIHATAYWWPHAIVKIATHNDSTDLTNTHRLIKSQPYCTGTTHTEHGKCGKIHACI